MSHSSLVECTVALVAAQASSLPLSTEALIASLQAIYQALVSLEPRQPMEPLTVRSRIHISCLECGRKFQLLSNRHLKLHGLTPRSYKRKYGIPLTRPLSTARLTAKRRRIAKQKGMGQELVAWREARNSTVAGV